MLNFHALARFVLVVEMEQLNVLLLRAHNQEHNHEIGDQALPWTRHYVGIQPNTLVSFESMRSALYVKIFTILHNVCSRGHSHSDPTPLTL